MNLAQLCVEWRFRRGQGGIWRVRAMVRCLSPELAARASRVWSGRCAYFEGAAARDSGELLGLQPEEVSILALALAARPGRGSATSAAHVLEANRFMLEFARRLRAGGMRLVGASALLTGPN